MARNNARLLTKKEMEYFNYRYSFFIENNKIAVKINNYSRTTYHSIDETFSILSKNIRKITFCKDAIYIWRECLEAGEDFSLIDVQQAVNRLSIFLQPISIDAVKDAIKAEYE